MPTFARWISSGNAAEIQVFSTREYLNAKTGSEGFVAPTQIFPAVHFAGSHALSRKINLVSARWHPASGRARDRAAAAWEIPMRCLPPRTLPVLNLLGIVCCV